MHIYMIKCQYKINLLHCILFPDIQIKRKFKIATHVDITLFEGKTPNTQRESRKKVSKTRANNSGSFEKSASAASID